MQNAGFFNRIRSLPGKLFKPFGSFLKLFLFKYRIVQIINPFQIIRFLVKGFSVFRFHFAETDGIQPGGVFNPLQLMTVSLAHKLAFILSGSSKLKAATQQDYQRVLHILTLI